MTDVKTPDAGNYVSRLVFDGRHEISRVQAIETLKAAATAIEKARARLEREQGAGADRRQKKTSAQA